jgi:hypothetical protein
VGQGTVGDVHNGSRAFRSLRSPLPGGHLPGQPAGRDQPGGIIAAALDALQRRQAAADRRQPIKCAGDGILGRTIQTRETNPQDHRANRPDIEKRQEIGECH